MKTILLGCFLFLYAFAYAQDTTSVLKFGAKGDGVTDNTAALTKAFNYCIENNKTCYIPKSDKSYIIQNTVHLPLQSRKNLIIKSNGATIELGAPESFKGYLVWKLTPMFKEIALFSFGPAASTQSLKTGFLKENQSSVSITGLMFKGSKLNFTPKVQPNQLIVSGLDISVDKVSLDDLSFMDLQGYGLRSFSAKNLQIRNVQMFNVGGRGSFPKTDAFGDGIYISVLKKDATVLIDGAKITGAVIDNRRSRSGITFEFSTQPYTANINNSTISRFAKALHFEEAAPASIEIKNCNFSEFNYGIAMVANKQSVLNISNSTLICSGTDGVEPGDGGPTINTNNGGTINFYNSTINLNGKKHAYITMVGVKLLKNCTINGNNKNPYFGDGTSTFDSCNFVDFGGPSFSFFAWGQNISTFNIINSKFTGGGPVNAQGQRVNLEIRNSTSSNALTPQIFKK